MSDGGVKMVNDDYRAPSPVEKTGKYSNNYSKGPRKLLPGLGWSEKQQSSLDLSEGFVGNLTKRNTCGFLSVVDLTGSYVSFKPLFPPEASSTPLKRRALPVPFLCLLLSSLSLPLSHHC